jgi:F-type H+-transporting ATPase subunit epsilon
MKLKILSLEGTLFEGEVSQVSLPTIEGVITVLKNHIPVITQLKQGTIKTPDNSFEISGGFAEITGEKVVVLAN